MTLEYTGKLVGSVPPTENIDWCDHGAELGQIALHAVERTEAVLPPADFEVDEDGTQIYDMLCHLHHLADRLGLEWRKMLHLADGHYRNETGQGVRWEGLTKCPECDGDVMYNLTVYPVCEHSQAYVKGSSLAICDNGHQITERARENGLEEVAEELLG